MIQKLELHNFRNYKKAEIEFSTGINIIWGENGQGKTNILEAIHVLSFTKSMRTNRNKDLIKINEDFAVVKGDNLEIQISGISNQVMIKDGVKYETAREWLGLLPVVFFGPLELNIVRGEPLLRRRFMDMAICQYNPRYIRALSVYKRAKEQKTKILRDFPEKPSLLDVINEFNEKMIQSGEFIIQERKMFIESLKEKSNIYHSGISGNRELLNIEYSPKTNLRAEMEYKRESEIQKGVCLVGPHRDDFNISLSGLNSRIFASQGQLRTAALSLKLAERDILKEKLENTPIMLLDDVLSELDEKRREYILSHQDTGQTLITDCEPSRLKALSIGKTLYVGDGKIG